MAGERDGIAEGFGTAGRRWLMFFTSNVATSPRLPRSLSDYSTPTCRVTGFMVRCNIDSAGRGLMQGSSRSLMYINDEPQPTGPAWSAE